MSSISLALGFSTQAFGALSASRINGLLMIVGTLLLLPMRRVLWSWDVAPPTRHDQDRVPILESSPATAATEMARAA